MFNGLKREKKRGARHQEKEEQVVEELVKIQMRRICFPSVLEISPTLKNSGNYTPLLKRDKELVKRDTLAPHSFWCLKGVLGAISSISEKTLSAYLVMTLSPIPHLDLTEVSRQFQELRRKEKHKSGVKIEAVRLDSFKTEKAFQGLLESYLVPSKRRKEKKKGTKKKRKILLIQIDPLSSSSQHINHVQHLCTNLIFKLRESHEQQSGPFNSIVFLVHLPPGVRERERKFAFDFHDPWVYWFVDDIRHESFPFVKYGEELNEQQPLPSILMSTPLNQLCEKQIIDLEGVIENSLSPIVCRVSFHLQPLPHLPAPPLPLFDPFPHPFHPSLGVPKSETLPKRLQLFRTSWKLKGFRLFFCDIVFRVIKEHTVVPKKRLSVELTDSPCSWRWFLWYLLSKY